MNSILGFAQLLESDPTGPLTGSQKENVEQILNSGNHLLELINEVLDLSRIESGKLQISIETIELDQVIEEALTTIEPMVQRYNIKINKKVECDNQYVRADLTRLKQVVINLLSNAIKYNKEYGSVIISCEYPASDTIRLNIEDTGFGISREKLESLFEPFNRLGAETLNIEGTGIGLTITKRLVELMDGSIGVKSKIGEGTKFYVDLKKAEAPVFEDSKVESVLDKKHHKEITERQTLLYVDDNPASLKLVESILKRRHNIDLLTANKAQPGIEIARTNHPDIILMDINLPDIDGYEALKLLKIHDDTKDIPVIAISANAMPKDIEKGKAADFKDYITKPINITKFLHVIDNALTNKVSKVG